MLVWPDPTGVTIVPGMIHARACRLRVAVGIASIMSRFTTTVARLLTTSTTGVSPVTVIVSLTLPTSSSLLTGAVKLPSSTMPARRIGLKPAMVNVTLYVPGLRSLMRYWPAPSVTALRVRSMSAGLDASTVTPGSAAPVPSFTTPAIAACACASRGRTRIAANPTTRLNRRRRIGSPPKDIDWRSRQVTARRADVTSDQRAPNGNRKPANFHGFARFGVAA